MPSLFSHILLLIFVLSSPSVSGTGDEDKEYTVRFIKADGKSFTVSGVKADNTLAEILAKHTTEQLSVKRLLYRGGTWDPEAKLSDLNFTDEDTIHVVERGDTNGGGEEYTVHFQKTFDGKSFTVSGVEAENTFAEILARHTDAQINFTRLIYKGIPWGPKAKLSDIKFTDKDTIHVEAREDAEIGELGGLLYVHSEAGSAVGSVYMGRDKKIIAVLYNVEGQKKTFKEGVEGIKILKISSLVWRILNTNDPNDPGANTYYMEPVYQDDE